MKHLHINDCAVLIGLNADADCVYSEAVPLSEYWDSERVWDNDKQVKKLKLHKVLGFLFGQKGNLLQQFESTFDRKTGTFNGGWVRHEDGTLQKFGRPKSRSNRSRAKTRAQG